MTFLWTPCKNFSFKTAKPEQYEVKRNFDTRSENAFPTTSEKETMSLCENFHDFSRDPPNFPESQNFFRPEIIFQIFVTFPGFSVT